MTDALRKNLNRKEANIPTHYTQTTKQMYKTGSNKNSKYASYFMQHRRLTAGVVVWLLSNEENVPISLPSYTVAQKHYTQYHP